MGIGYMLMEEMRTLIEEAPDMQMHPHCRSRA